MSNFFLFFEKTTRFQKFVAKVFNASPIVVVFKFREMLPTGNQ